MKKTVSEKQITRLFEFTRENKVIYSDLQIELVDHLSNAIEEYWKQHPNVDFETALEEASFNEFGLTGFQDIILFRRAALAKRYNHFLLNCLKDFFKLPKNLLLVALTGVIYFLSTLVSNPFFFWKCLFILLPLEVFIIFIINVFTGKSMLKSLVKHYKKENIWLLEDIIYKGHWLASSSFIYLYPLIILFSFQDILIFTNLLSFILSIVFVFCSLLLYLTRYYLPKNVEKYLAETYPEYKIAKS